MSYNPQNPNGQAIMANSSPVTIASDQSTMPIKPAVNTANGWLPYHLVSAASNNATNVKGSAGQLGTFYCLNTNASIRYVKFYDKATTPVPGTDTPVLTFGIPGNASGAGGTFATFAGYQFSNGIGFAMVVNPADSDNTGVGASDLVMSIGYA